MGVKCTVCGRTKKPIGRDSMDNGLCEYECEGYLQEPYPSSHWDSELKDEFVKGFNTAIDKAVEVVETLQKDAYPDEIYHYALIAKELKKLKELEANNE